MKQVLLALMLIAIPVALFSGYEVYASRTNPPATTGLGDLSDLTTIINDVSSMASSGDLAAAKGRITDFESAWDQRETAIRPLNPTYWGNVDDAADVALKALRASSPDPAGVKAALAALLAALADPSTPA